MFWGLIMEPNKRYTQTVEKSFHVSMASLDALHADGEIVQVMVYFDKLNYLMCSLQKGVEWQVPLDLNFQEGTEISFTCNGRGRVHLTGYLIPEDTMDMDDLDEVEDEEEDEDDEVPQLVGKQPKRKAQESPKDSKKIKRLKALMQEESSDDDEDDLENDDDQDESLQIDEEVEDDSDDDEEEQEEEEEEEEEEDDSEEEKVVKPEQKKLTKKELQQANKKQEKQKLVNGKDAKPEPAKQEKKKGKEAKEQVQQQQQKKVKGEQQNNAQQVQKKRTVDGGVQIEDVKVGTGANAKSGKFVSVYYIGRLTNGKKFDATTQGEGFKFRLGKGEVIKGWDVGIAGMKIGGKRRITIPPGMAYGAKGSPPVIPGNSTLVFEVELKNVH